MSATATIERQETASAEPRTVWEVVERGIERFADRPALALRDVQPESRWTYRDLGQQVDRVARRLLAHGIERGDRVLLWGSNRPQWSAVFCALLRVGAIVVPLDYRSAPDFVERVAGKTRPKALLADRALSETFEGEVGSRILIEDLFEPAAEETMPPLPPPTGDLDDLVEIVFTSGTTGEPKGVMITNRNVLANVRGVGLVLDIQPYYRTVSLLPLSHLFEQVGLVCVLANGASAVYLHTLRPASIFEAIKEERATLLIAVPQILDLFLQGIEREVRRAGKQKQWEMLHSTARRLPFGVRRHLFRPLHEKLGGRFEFFFAGGAPLDPEIGYRWENMGIKVLQGYGTTESAPGVSMTRLSARSMDTVGWPLEGIEIKLAPDDEIWIRGPAVTPGYWEDPEATAEAFEDGWYKTGDLGELDAQGRLKIKGRKKNLIVLANGLNVYPEDVETALRLNVSVKDAVVVGLKRGRADVDVHAILLMENPDEADQAVKAANRRLAAHQQIRGHTLWPDEDFPRTLTLKARRPMIEQRLKEMGVGETA